MSNFHETFNACVIDFSPFLGGKTTSIPMYYLEEYTELGNRVDSFVGDSS